MPGIFTPLQIKGKTLKNRIVMGSAERVGFTYEDGLMGEDVIQEYEAYLINGVGSFSSSCQPASDASSVS
jgi:2,4-dienoyl-CoA reductase-like NADH-dependent reductase (Old Yellow Enzyme family)